MYKNIMIVLLLLSTTLYGLAAAFQKIRIETLEEKLSSCTYEWKDDNCVDHPVGEPPNQGDKNQNRSPIELHTGDGNKLSGTVYEKL